VAVSEQVFDPVEALFATLENTWQTISSAYDVSNCLPDLQTLFASANLSAPQQSAEAVVAAMLMEVTESVGRFSPWYKMPARSFGLTAVRTGEANRSQWVLAPEAIQRWQRQIDPVAEMIHRYSGLIKAMVLVDDLMQDIPGDPCVTAHCNCSPAHAIRIRKSVLVKAEILCDKCHQPYMSTVI